MIKVKKDIKIKVFIFLIVLISIGIMALFSTQAFVTSTVEQNYLEYDYLINMDINNKENLNLTIGSNSKSIIELKINNTFHDGLINYGIVYSVEGYEDSKLLPNINVYKNSSSLNETIGSINKDEEKIVSIIIENNEKVDLVFNFNIVLGYKNGGELILNTNEHYIYDKLLDELLNEYGNTSSIIDKKIEETPSIYPDVDNDGDTFYYKNIDKYIYFANNYFKIIRINGDNSIRLLYIGKDINKDSYIDYTTFNNLDNDNTFVGYKYSDTLEENYDLTHSNKYDSNIKTILDNWYLNNLKDYSKYINNSKFCNNRITSINGYSNLETTYISKERNNNLKYSLMCNSNDLFIEPIGLLTYDEVKMMKLTNDLLIWTISPSSFNEKAKVYAYSNELKEINVSDKAYVKPVISLKENTLVKGNGTKESPYEVVYE